MALFKDVAEYIKELTASSEPQFEIPATKKRKLNGADASEHQIGNFDQKNAGKGGEMDAPWPSVPMPDVSFSVPQRKKLLLQISPQPSLGIRALNPTTKEKEFGVCWRDIGEGLLRIIASYWRLTSRNRTYCLSPGAGKGTGSVQFCCLPQVRQWYHWASGRRIFPRTSALDGSRH